jgi:hypothetical protein
MMTRPGAFRRTEDCRWSVPACRRNPMSDDENDFEIYWACDRAGREVPVTPADCARCPYWTPESGRTARRNRRRFAPVSAG